MVYGIYREQIIIIIRQYIYNFSLAVIFKKYLSPKNFLYNTFVITVINFSTYNIKLSFGHDKSSTDFKPMLIVVCDTILSLYSVK